MAAVKYQYYKPSLTFTIDAFIACQSKTDVCYNNLSFRDKVNYAFMNETIDYDTYNVISDYVEELRESCVTVELSDEDMIKYMYRPKLLCNYLYGSGELAFIILIINDMYSVKQFTKNNLLMPTRATMSALCKSLYNSNIAAINKYNKNNKAI